MEFLNAVGDLLGHPIARSSAIVISIVSLIVAYISFRKTSTAVDNYWKNVGADQARFLEQQWSATYQLMFSSADFAKQHTAIFGLASEDIAKEDAAILLYINICASAFNSFKHGVISSETLKSHMISFFSHYKGDKTKLNDLINLAGYDEDFRSECRKYYASPESSPPPAKSQ